MVTPGPVFYALKDTPLGVELLQRLRLGVVHVQTVQHSFRLVVVPLDQRAAAGVAHALRFRGRGHHVVGGAALGAGPAARHAVDDLLIGNLDVQYAVKPDACGLQGLGLGDGAGHAVQDIALCAIGLRQTLGDNADDHLVGHQFARVHVALGLEPHARTVFHGRAQDVACGNGGNAQPPAEDGGLGPLTGARGAEHN